MFKKQFIVSESNVSKRRTFYKYIKEKYNLKIYMNRYKMIHNKFPFVVDFNDNSFWICESITCCACAQLNKKIITIDKFKEIEKEN